MATKKNVEFSGFSTSSRKWSESDKAKMEKCLQLCLKGQVAQAAAALSGLAGSVPHAKQIVTRRIRAGEKSAF